MGVIVDTTSRIFSFMLAAEEAKRSLKAWDRKKEYKVRGNKSRSPDGRSDFWDRKDSSKV